MAKPGPATDYGLRHFPPEARMSVTWTALKSRWRAKEGSSEPE
jgi:hypothetical protein